MCFTLHQHYGLPQDRDVERMSHYYAVFDEYVRECEMGESADWVDYIRSEDVATIAEANRMCCVITGAHITRAKLLEIYRRGAADTAEKSCIRIYGY